MTQTKEAKRIYYKFLNSILKDSGIIIKEFVGLNPMAISKQSEINCDLAKRSAIICVDEIIKENDNGGGRFERIKYWESVKNEIEKL